MFVLFIIILFPNCSGWDISQFTGPQSELRQVVVWRTRAYLCVPRQLSDELGHATATLLSAPWPETWDGPWYLNPSRLLHVQPFPNLKIQVPDRKSNLLSVVSADVCPRGKLIVLDRGDGGLQFEPKIVIFDLTRRNKLMSRTTLSSLSFDQTATIAADPINDCIYISDAPSQRIIVFDLVSRRWYPVNVSISHPLTGLSIFSSNLVSDLAVSKVKPYLYFTSMFTLDIYSLDTSNIRSVGIPSNLTAKSLSGKLDYSIGLLTDHNAFLHYALARFRTTVRCDESSDLTAEAHDITMQDVRLGGVGGFFTDPQKQVWVFLRKSMKSQHCIKIQDYKMNTAVNDFTSK